MQLTSTLNCSHLRNNSRCSFASNISGHNTLACSIPDFFSSGNFQSSLSNSRKESLMHLDDSIACRWPYMSGARFFRNREQMCFVSLLEEDDGALLLPSDSVLLLVPSSAVDFDDVADDGRMPLGALPPSPPPLANGNTCALISRFGFVNVPSLNQSQHQYVWGSVHTWPPWFGWCGEWWCHITCDW